MRTNSVQRVSWWDVQRLILVATVVPIATMAAWVETSAAADKPQILKTVPADGADDVDPDLKEIRVTFDQDMDKGMSWTGGPPDFPNVDKSRKARWVDKRTCVLPVILEPEMSYRVGFNSESFKNFQSIKGTAADPSEINFTTTKSADGKGASKPKEKRAAPKIVKLEPANDAKDVDPSTKELKVTFDVPMDSGMSWTGGGDNFPKIPNGKKPKWSADGKTCTLPVSLEPDHDYELGINSVSFKNFRSKAGVPAEPVIYQFHTSAAKDK
jgi:hypothetical protein